MGLNGCLSVFVLSCVGSGLATGHTGLLYHNTMEMEQIMARLLAEKKAEIRTNQTKTDSILKEMKANQEEMLARKEDKIEVNSEKFEVLREDM
jgi:hypothetical protein